MRACVEKRSVLGWNKSVGILRFITHVGPPGELCDRLLSEQWTLGFRGPLTCRLVHWDCWRGGCWFK